MTNRSRTGQSLAWFFAVPAIAGLAALITAIVLVLGLAGGERSVEDDVGIMIVLGVPGFLAASIFGTVALMMAKPSGSWARTIRRGALSALVGASFYIVLLQLGVDGYALHLVPGVAALIILALDIVRIADRSRR